MRYAAVLLGAVLAACGGASSSGSPAAAPVMSASQAMRDFMQAVADSNLTRMGQLWGTAKGAAGEINQPPELFEKRLILMQTYLRADSSKVVSDVSISGEADKRQVTVAIYRKGCMKQVPAVMIRLGNKGWIVNNVDLAPAGNPARPCEPS